jgi:hypothetical protein
MGGTQTISRPQQAQTSLLSLMRKSASFLCEHLQASRGTTPPAEAGDVMLGTGTLGAAGTDAIPSSVLVGLALLLRMGLLLNFITARANPIRKTTTARLQPGHKTVTLSLLHQVRRG